MPTCSLTPIAANTGDSSTHPAWQAEPVEAATPFNSESTSVSGDNYDGRSPSIMMAGCGPQRSVADGYNGLRVVTMGWGTACGGG